MNRRSILLSRTAGMAGILFGLCGVAGATPVGAAFTYQGRLTDGGNPANGAYDLAFRLYDAPVGGNPVGAALNYEDVPVADGLFTLLLQFGELSDGIFNGQQRWVEISVRPGSSSDTFTTLGRQELTATPYAAHALQAGGLQLPFNGSWQGPGTTMYLENSGSGTCLQLESDEGSGLEVYLGAASENPAIRAEHAGLAPALWAETTQAAAVFAATYSNSPAIVGINAGGGPAAILLGGNVGIGTQSPDEKLSVGGVIETKYDGGIKFPDGTLQVSAAPWSRGPGGAAYLVGDVGIGTNDPAAALHIKRPLAETGIRFETTRSNQGPAAVASKAPTSAAMAGAGVAWTNPTSAIGLNGQWASANMAESAGGLDFDSTMRLEFSGFNFAIPATATITNVRVVVRGHAEYTDYPVDPGYSYVTAEATAYTQLLSGGPIQENSYSLNLDETVPENLDGPLLAAGLTPAEVNSPGFGVRLSLSMNMVFVYFWLGNWWHDVEDLEGFANVHIDSVVVEVLYYDESATLTASNFSMGIPEDAGAFVVAPGSDLVTPSENNALDGGIVIEPDRGNVGIGRVPTGVFGYKLDVDGEIRCDNLIETSSRRYKRNVRPLSGALDVVERLQGVSFDWDESHGGRPDIGFIAEEVGQVVPEIVDYERDGVNAVGMRYDRVGALAVEAIKEMRTMLREKDAQIAELKARVERLEARSSSADRP